MLYFNFTLLIIALLVSCKTNSEKTDQSYSLPEGYSLSNVHEIFLNQELREISGIAWQNGRLLAIEDESSVIFRLDSKTGKILEKQKFEKNKDIEDILIRNDTAWVLRSNGNLYRVIEFLTDTQETIIFDFPISQSRDLEAIASPAGGSVIFLFCKVCEWDEGPEKVSVFRFSLESMEFDTEPYHVIHRSQLKSVLSKKWKDVKMQPSAAAYHPLTGELYLISSTGKWLMTLDSDWNPTSFHWLNPRLFKQPEGITFDDSGNLYISNEADSGNANILLFPYQR
ncbi:MAG: SdiA-regulated domain-containing protein [Cyclobacteriaceae bacterium]